MKERWRERAVLWLKTVAKNSRSDRLNFYGPISYFRHTRSFGKSINPSGTPEWTTFVDELDPYFRATKLPKEFVMIWRKFP